MLRMRIAYDKTIGVKPILSIFYIGGINRFLFQKEWWWSFCWDLCIFMTIVQHIDQTPALFYLCSAYLWRIIFRRNTFSLACCPIWLVSSCFFLSCAHTAIIPLITVASMLSGKFLQLANITLWDVLRIILATRWRFLNLNVSSILPELTLA